MPQSDEYNRKQTTAPAVEAYKSNFQTMHLNAFRTVLYVGVGLKLPLRIFEHVLVIFLFCDTVLLDHAFVFANLGVLHMFRELFQCILLSAIVLNNA